MKSKMLLLYLVSLLFTSCFAQNNNKKSNFELFIESFDSIKLPLCYKTNIFNLKYNNKMSKQDALKYFEFTENDLKFNDFDYNFDDDIQYDNWIDILPYKLGKFIEKNYVALLYSIGKYPNYGVDTFYIKLATYTYMGEIIDKIEIRSQYTREEDWKDVVILENNVLRIFNYKPNLENYNVKGGIYYLIDENAPRTVVETEDYQIDENGKIKHIKTYPKQYLKKFVSFYRDYHADSDDPMNDY